MAINPDNVFIVNPDDLDTASSISNVDYVIIGQGNKYKTIAYTLFTTTFLGSITTQVNTLNNEVVKHVIQSLNSTQKQTARDNIEAVGVGDMTTVVKGLSYDLVTNTITYTNFDNTSGVLTLASGGGAQADWNATSGPSQILNLPTSFPPSSHTHAELGSVAYSSYNANTNLTANENRVFKFRSHIIGAGASNLFPISNTDANAVLDVATKNHDEWHQLGFSSDGNLYHRVNSTSTKGTWSFLVNNSYLMLLGYQTASQVTTVVNNALNNYGFAPNAFNYMHNATTIDTDDYREVIASYHNTSTSSATVLDANYDGVVLTIQAGNSQVDVAINVLSHNNPVTMFEVFADTAATFVWSDKLTCWIVRSTNKVY